MEGMNTNDPTSREEPLGFESVIILAGFFVRSVRRHRKVAAIAAGTTFFVSVVALLAMPPVFRSEGRILTHTAYFIPALASPTRSVPWQSQTSTIGALEIIRSRENFLKVIDESNMAERWAATRTRMGRIVDGLRSLFFGPLEGEQLQDALISILEKATLPNIEGDVISISIDWNDAEVARLVAEKSLKVFLDRRQNAEVSEIEDTVKILERNLEGSKPALAAAESNLRQVMAARGALRPMPRPAPAPTPAKNPAAGELAERRSRMGKLQAEFNSRIQRAQEKVDKLRESLGPSHPDMISAIRELDEATRPTDEMQQLQAEIMRSELEMSHTGGGEPDTMPADLQLALGVAAANRTDPAIEQASTDYKRARESYDEFKRRLSDARLELQTTKAAFGYRYIVTQPPLKPLKAIKPRPPVVLAGGLFASLVMGLLFAVFYDLRSRKVVESWMVERMAHVHLLGEIEEP